ncbi:Ig-like domain-containing protein [Gordonia sp. PP30]|uniref:L,D-transpeptidase n=1 Tax=Gordonia sp. PP30 TaxID=2935861 RepID=UPI001FFE591F|nr:Ig-like domain-containing protein [Gordonia sp. PP30]UQE74908.1 Ig-like domain-containing protein [Gordonia sp. PP30]
MRDRLLRLSLSAVALTAASTLIVACTNSTPKHVDAPPAAIALAPHDAKLNPTTPIVVDATGGTLTQVTVTNAAESGKQVTGKLDPGGRRWSTTEDLGYGATYTVDATAVNADQKPVHQTFTVNTIAPDSTAYANVVPDPDMVAQTGIGVGQPISVQFTAPVTNKAEVQKHLKVTTTPNQPGAWYWIDDQNVHYRGPDYWKPGTKIHLDAEVYGVDLGNGVYGAEDYSVDYTVHDSWIAKADGATELLTIFHNGQQVNQMPMSLGSPDTPSHNGPHVISEKSQTVTMDSCTYGVCAGQPGYYNETVLWDERISSDGEYVHAAPWSVGQQGSSNVSHGCVNLSTDNAIWFYNHFGLGDVVEITHSQGPTLPVWDTYGDWTVPWSTWQKGDADA